MHEGSLSGVLSDTIHTHLHTMGFPVWPNASPGLHLKAVQQSPFPHPNYVGELMSWKTTTGLVLGWQHIVEKDEG